MTQSNHFQQVATRVAMVSIVGNLLLSAFKLFAGIVGHSSAMVSDAVHSASDVFSSVIVIIGVSRHKKIPIPAMLDLAVFGLLIGQILGRWGNFMNREAFGAETEIFCRMGLTAPDGSTIFVHPTFLYESLWNLAGLIFLIVWTKKGHRKYDGQCTLIYFFWYGLGRAWIEGLRTDSLYIGSTNIRVSQALSIVLVLISLTLLILLSRRPYPPEKLYVNRVRAAEAAREETESTCAKEDN